MASSEVLLSAATGLAAGVIFLIVAYWKFAVGADERLSWANVQIITWTGVVLGSYVAFGVLKRGFPDSIPDNLLVLMGISIGTQAGSKLVRAVQDSNRKKKGNNDPNPVEAAGFRGLMAAERDVTKVSVAKLQHLAWTVVAIVFYLIVVWRGLTAGATSLPDIGNGLPTLMGISASGYIANKIGDSPK